MNVAVIGGGMFGAMSAIRLAESGARVTLFERNRELLRGASLNNQNRLHLGFHYPRDERTARQCAEGFDRFRAEFTECINDGFVNAYFVASEGSLTTPEQYLAFCDRVGLRYRPIEIDGFQPEVRGVSLGIAVDEVVYDAAVLRSLVLRRLEEVITVLGCGVDHVYRRGNRFTLQTNGRKFGPFDAVINCTYADVNRLGAQLGHRAVERQYEYTRVAVVACEHPPVGITIMDGRFMTLLPFGNTGNFLLYHVDHAVTAKASAKQLPSAWRDSKWTSEAWGEWFDAMRFDCERFAPSLESARAVDFLEGPRMVLAHNELTDARPSFVEEPEPGYLTVFAGKIDHSIWIADEVAARVMHPIKAAA